MVALNNEYRKKENKSDYGSDPRSVLERAEQIMLSVEKSRFQIDEPVAIVRIEAPAAKGDNPVEELMQLAGLQDNAPYISARAVGWLAKVHRAVPEIILCFDRKPSTIVEGYLYPTTLDKCGVTYESAFDTLARVSKEKAREIKELIQETDGTSKETKKEKLNDWAMGITVYRLDPHHREIAELAIKEWEEVLKEVFRPYDPFIGWLYTSWITPIPIAKYAPHAILITPTAVGKTTLGNIVGESLDRATSVSLVGGRFDSAVRAGIVDGKDYLHQIEQFEVNEPDTLPYVHSLMSNGEARRAVYGSVIRTHFTGPLVFTGNIELDSQRTLAEFSLKLVNAEALGSRLVPIVKDDVETPVREINFGVAREVIHAARWLARKAVYTIYNIRKVKEWLEDPEIEGWDNAEGAVYAIEWRFEAPKAYLLSFTRNGTHRVKSLALAHAIAKNLHIIYKERENALAKVLESAEEALAYIVPQLVAGFKVLGNEVVPKDYDRLIWSIANSKKKKFVREILEGLHNALHAIMRSKRLEALTKPVELPKDTVLNYIKDTIDPRLKKSLPEIERRLIHLSKEDVGRIIELEVTESTVIFKPSALIALWRDINKAMQEE